MEALTPIQRIAVITIGLVLTIAVAMLVLPWISEQIDERLELSNETTSPGPTDTPAIEPTPTRTAAWFTWPSVLIA